MSVNLAEIMPEFEQFVEATRTANEESGYILFKNIAIDVLITIIKDFLNCDNTCYNQPYIGAFWISTLNGTKFLTNGIVFSAYFHPNEDHKAITVGYNGYKTSIAERGKWAVCFQTKARRNNKSGYETLGDIANFVYRSGTDRTIQTMGAALGIAGGVPGESLSRRYINGHFASNYIEANC